MSERITCPHCEKSIDMDQIETGDIWRERVDLALRLNSVWKVANEYVEAFRTKPGARMSLKKRSRHLRGLAILWETCEFEFQGKKYRTNHDSIRNAMTTICEMEKVGFQNHNYLKKVLLPTASRVSAEGKTAKEETATEQEKLFKPKRDSEVEALGDVVNVENYKERHGIESLADQVGKELP